MNRAVTDALTAGRWLALHPDPTSRTATWYRWARNTHGDQCREEITIVFDAAGRIETWTLWHNVRVQPPDHTAGRTDRLLDFLTTSHPAAQPTTVDVPD